MYKNRSSKWIIWVKIWVEGMKQKVRRAKLERLIFCFNTRNAIFWGREGWRCVERNNKAVTEGLQNIRLIGQWSWHS